jgi:hypothetical protein
MSSRRREKKKEKRKCGGRKGIIGRRKVDQGMWTSNVSCVIGKWVISRP